MTDMVTGILTLARRRGWLGYADERALRDALPVLAGAQKREVAALLADKDAERARSALVARRRQAQDKLARKWSR